jgi:hypothetical protein
MTQYLLAAEADKIQDFVFRSSRLREVVGGSQLLSRFCEEVPSLLKPLGDSMDIVISAGGSFRIIFDEKIQATSFGEQLAEVYHCAMDSTLTIAEPVAINSDFGNASDNAEKALRKAKLWRHGWQSQEHMPYMAFCASCGVGLAVDYRAYNEGSDRQYMCASCLNKNAERERQEQAEEEGSFLGDFYRVVLQELQKPEDPRKVDWPGKKEHSGRSEKDPTEDIADYDPRRYVAYLLADGNRMGEIFGECENSDQMKKLSKGLTNAIRRALAVPTKEIMKNNDLEDDKLDFIPVLPLILGGDDLFALIPAPWALDFAQSFCQTYELGIEKLINDLGLKVPRPTISAAVVICKSKHPYKLAHEVGEARLEEAKHIGKCAILKDKENHSTINFEVVLGGRLVIDSPSGNMRPTLRPYWVMNEEPSDWGLSIQSLIDQRFELRNIPNKRLSEIQSFYDLSKIPKKHDEEHIDPWQENLKRLISRIRQRNKDQGDDIETALKQLGGNTEDYWLKIDRDEDEWYGHGLPDLLEAWDFALEIKKNRREYLEGR